jgi:hypothetical protein
MKKLDPDLISKLVNSNSSDGRTKLAMAMIEPIRRRRYGGPWSVCDECGCPQWEKEDVHTDDDCVVYRVMES